ncbi:MAG: PEP-CTERM sorting domain-containing protein [Anaerolineae bacterium]
MKPRWLLLGVSVLCLLVLFPASALSQRAELQATCGSANVDGVRSPGEWDNAGVVAMFPISVTPGDSLIADLGLEGGEWDASLAQTTVTAWLYAMNDESHLYLAELLYLDSVVANPLYWMGIDFLRFMDEPDALDGDWEAADCDPLPGEGEYLIIQEQNGGAPVPVEHFVPIAQGPVGCDPVTPIPGVNWAMAPGSLFVEWEIDLSASDVDKVGPGDCFLINKTLIGLVCPQGTSNCPNQFNWVQGAARWPQLTIGVPTVAGMLCLDPCEVEFVPEPGSILLLGSGLMGLAGYATLRWRTRE